ncbi:MAG: branched-chain amino acid ABC transporter permease [Stagnimonas sp.]|jgi:branched-chain amino acid transport system permease protein|nr:branched-chain amino acid ABC transporter permease [Stagnimonas sp.]
MTLTSDRKLTIALLVALPVAAALTDNAFYKAVLVFGMINAVAAVGLCLMLGFAGQISLGQAAFYGLGAYGTTLMASRFGVEPVLAIAAGALLSMAVGWSISRPLSRLHDHYLAMATLAFGIIMFIVFANARSLTGGLDPGTSIAKFSIMGRDLSSMNQLFWVVWVGLVLAAFVAGNIASNQIGRSLLAVKMSAAAAASVGIDVVRAKAFVFAIGALLTGLSGGLYAYFARSFNATSFGIGYSIELLMMVVLGSLSRVSGAIVGAFIITVLPVVFENFEDYKTLTFGVTMVIIMKYMPSGLVDGILGLPGRLSRRAKA